MKSQRGGILNLMRLLKNIRIAFNGIASAWKNETSFRQEMLVIVPLLPVGIWIGITAAQKALLVLSVLLILIIELLNSAVETLVDRVGTERHELSGRAKDMGSAAVMISIIAAAAVWGIIIWEKIMN